ncbi:MAG: hypothetical protein ACRD0U_02905 [Acidimicrobiales bacterium]
MRPTIRRLAASGAVAAALVTVVGCSDDNGWFAHGPSSTPPDEPTGPVDLGHGLIAEPPSGWTIDPFADPQPYYGSDDCLVAETRFANLDDDLAVNVSLVNRGCSTGEPQDEPLNGQHGTYVVPGGAGQEDLDRLNAPAGDLVIFDQTYTECTNDCRDWTEAVALVLLDEPADEDYPTVMLVGEERVSGDEVAGLARTIRRRP